MTDKQCAHPACSCRVDKDSKYCSQYCRDAGDTLEIACNCGHADCGDFAVADTLQEKSASSPLLRST